MDNDKKISTTSNLEELLKEETLKLILSDREIQIQENSYNWDWSWYSVRYRTIRVMSELVSWVTNYLLKSQETFISNMKISFEKIFSDEIYKQFTKKKIVEIVQNKFHNIVASWFNREIESKISSELKEELRQNYLDWWQEKLESKIKYLAKIQWENDANKYLEENKEKIMEKISENSTIKVEVIQKETITWTTTVN